MARIIAHGAWVAGLCLTTLFACKEEARKQLYFEELKPPLGAGNVEVVTDTSLNKETGGEIAVRAVVETEIDRDELERLMQSFLRQTRARRGFFKGAPQVIDIRLYVSKPQAEKGGDDWLAQVQQTSANSEPTLTNKQKAPLLKWVNQALGKMQEFSGALKPQILADPAQMTVELNWPFVAHDGTGQYVEKLTPEKATTEFSSIAITLFEKISPLKKLTFIGKHADQVVMRVVLTREQFVELDLKQQEELLGAYQGQFIELILSKQITEEKVAAKTRKQRQKVYRELFSRLPAEQVELTKDLR